MSEVTSPPSLSAQCGFCLQGDLNYHHLVSPLVRCKGPHKILQVSQRVLGSLGRLPQGACVTPCCPVCGQIPQTLPCLQMWLPGAGRMVVLVPVGAGLCALPFPSALVSEPPSKALLPHAASQGHSLPVSGFFSGKKSPPQRVLLGNELGKKVRAQWWQLGSTLG